jgi:hypothetical protein
MKPPKRDGAVVTARLKGGRSRLIDHERMKAMLAAGKLHWEIVEELGISMASVARILKGVKKG